MSQRVHLPVVVDRRIILRGTAAALLAALGGCVGAAPQPDDQGGDPGDGGGGGGGGGGGASPDAGTGGSTPTPAAPGVERCGTSLCMPLADPANAALRAVDGARLIDVDGKKLLVARIEQAQFIVLSAICTHMGCVVRYSSTQADIECPCHGSRFQLDGAVKVGPAATPLRKYTATYDAGSNTVTIALS